MHGIVDILIGYRRITGRYIILQRLNFCGRRRKSMQGACINHAGLRYRHALRAEEIQIPAYLVIFNGINRTGHINLAIHNIDDVIRYIGAALLIEVHVHHFVSLHVKLRKRINARFIAINHFTNVHIGTIFGYVLNATVRAHHAINGRRCHGRH